MHCFLSNVVKEEVKELHTGLLYFNFGVIFDGNFMSIKI